MPETSSKLDPGGPPARDPGRPPARGPGRPRRGDIDERLLNAAVSLYVEHGLAGFNFDAVARRAGVGKPALYLRWQSREELLIAALEHGLKLDGPVEDFDTGSLRDDLIMLAQYTCNWLLSDAGAALLRLRVEQQFNDVLRGLAWTRLSGRQVRSARRITKRAVARGELPPDIDQNMLLEAIGGAVQVRTLNTPWSGRPKLLKSTPQYAETLVDYLLTGLYATYGWQPPGG